MFSEAIQIRLLDVDGNLMDKDSSSVVEIQIVEGDTALSGTTLIAFVNGEASFNGLVFTAEPGRTNVPFQLRCSAIDNEVVSRVRGQSVTQTYNSKMFYITM